MPRENDVMGAHSEWEEPVERDGCLLWRAWVGGVSATHAVLLTARKLARAKAEREGVDELA